MIEIGGNTVVVYSQEEELALKPKPKEEPGFKSKPKERRTYKKKVVEAE
ncbi:hypothetical protein [Solemya elarraichensis gill symbiont]|nr:hypothetical protein [Solemya elarraichensis gill symbiont]